MKYSASPTKGKFALFAEPQYKKMKPFVKIANLMINQLIKKYNFLKSKLALIEDGEWRKDKELRNMSIDQINEMIALVGRCEELGMGILSRLRKRTRN